MQKLQGNFQELTLGNSLKIFLNYVNFTIQPFSTIFFPDLIFANLNKLQKLPLKSFW